MSAESEEATDAVEICSNGGKGGVRLLHLLMDFDAALDWPVDDLLLADFEPPPRLTACSALAA